MPKERQRDTTVNGPRRTQGPDPAPTLVCRSFAKVNLYLDVLPRRADGFHNIETVFQTVGLWDELSFAPAGDGEVSLTCSRGDLSTGPDNLVRRAAALLNREAGTRHGARIHLDKRIPVAAGLAGGSGNAAAALAALSTLWGLDFTRPRLARLALELGSDVPYCLTGGLMAGTLRGEEIHPLPPAPETWFVLVHPPVAVSTRDAYNHPLLEKNAERPFAGKTASFRRALRALAAGDLSGTLFNRMEAPIFQTHPQLAGIKAALLGAGCAAAVMSGSGPTVYGVCPSQDEAQSCRDRIAKDGLEYPVSVVGAVSAGLEFA